MPSLLYSQVLSNKQDNASESGVSTRSLREQLLKLLLFENESLNEFSTCTLKTWRFGTLLISSNQGQVQRRQIVPA